MSVNKRSFQAEVSKLLNIVAHSLYSEREVFLRELISNAADACDKLRYLALTDEKLVSGDNEFKVKIATNKKAKTLLISDNGIGMNESDLDDNLGMPGTKDLFKGKLKERDERIRKMIQEVEGSVNPDAILKLKEREGADISKGRRPKNITSNFEATVLFNEGLHKEYLEKLEETKLQR